MQIQITGHQFDVTDALRNLTEEKFKRLERHFDQITNIDVKFEVEKLSQICEANILVAKNKIHARAASSDIYKSVDEVLEKLDRQLIKHKEKLRDHRDNRDIITDEE